MTAIDRRLDAAAQAVQASYREVQRSLFRVFAEGPDEANVRSLRRAARRLTAAKGEFETVGVLYLQQRVCPRTRRVCTRPRGW